MDKEPITSQGLEKLKKELEELKNIKRPKIVKAIAEARGHGDLKENAEYHAAKEEQAKNEGKIFTVGVSINNLSLNENDIGDFRTFLKLSPPLRTENDRQSLVEAVSDGTIDVIVSDHKPEDVESKRLTFSQAATGATGVETLLPLALELFHNKSVKLMKLIASITSNPAKILGINKGSLEKGNEADLCVFDINKPWIVNKDKLKSKSKNTPVEDRKLQGQVLKTFVKGEMAFEKV